MLKNFISYQLAVELHRHCAPLKLLRHEKEQLNRASLSIVLNLSEGSAKPTEKDRKRFYAIAYASCREVQAILSITGNDGAFELADRLGGAPYRLSRG